LPIKGGHLQNDLAGRQNILWLLADIETLHSCKESADYKLRDT